MAITYSIENTDNSTSFTIAPQTYDGFGGVQRNTDLSLMGNLTELWGEKFNENFYRLTENFACPETAPNTPQNEAVLGGGHGINAPIAGQLWFNKTDEKLYVFSGSSWAGVGEGALSTAMNVALGGVTDGSGDFDGTAVDALLASVTGSTDLLDVLDQMDDAISVGGGGGIISHNLSSIGYVVFDTGGPNFCIQWGSHSTAAAPPIVTLTLPLTVTSQLPIYASGFDTNLFFPPFPDTSEIGGVAANWNSPSSISVQAEPTLRIGQVAWLALGLI